MIRVAHLLDDFGMGGVTRALTLFDDPRLSAIANSRIVPVAPEAKFAPSLEADLIVDHMALSWKRLAFLASLRLRNPRARIVHVEHSYTRAFEEDNVASPRRFRKMLRLASLLVDQFICVSNAQREWLTEEVGISAAKLQTIYPWSGRFELGDVPAQKPRGDRPLRLLAYGRFSAIKNFDALVRAMRPFAVQDVELTLFGDGPDRALLSQLAAPLTHVKIEGATNDISAHLEDCDAVIIPSRNEAFGLVATEARLAGRAIIVADVDGLPEQVGSAGMTTPLKHPGDISAAIRWALRAPLEVMGEAGRGEVASQHDEIIERWISVFREVEDLRGGDISPSQTMAA